MEEQTKQLTEYLAHQLNISAKQIDAVLALLQQGSTIPFIARYRKDSTGNLDEVQIVAIKEGAETRKEFLHRQEFIVKAIIDQEKMTDELQAKIDACTTLSALEDLYLPYKPKRKTKAQAARDKGLEPLALQLLAQDAIVPETVAADYINEQVPTADEALQGARDIIAEIVNEDADTRAAMRKLYAASASLQSSVMTGKEEDGIKYKDYFGFEESIATIPSHRAMAVFRGFMEGVLRMGIQPNEESAMQLLHKRFVKKQNATTPHLEKALRDSYKRLLQPAMESDCRMELKTRCDEEAIAVFADNLRQLLLASPLGGKRLIAIDPGYRTGCKTVVLDEQGNLLHNDVIYLHQEQQALQKIQHLISDYRIDVMAVGDGTAGRETEKLVRQLQTGLPVYLVNEDGASIYSASEVARDEFPHEDITVRGAVSIGRRLMDPLAELVKIDAKSIGVGQYQHDVNQVRLKEKLDQTVMSCVNQVGVNLNTASYNLLQYVSGIGETIARNIVAYRKANGPFSTRQQLMQVPRLGDKAFEQCAGFLRIPQAKNPLDASGVHPEQYAVVEKMVKNLGVEITQVIGNESLVAQLKPEVAADSVGRLALQDILRELKKPGMDPRSPLSDFRFAEIYTVDDLYTGMIVPGKVTNLTKFGAFVDIGIKQDGLVHVSEIANKYISDPAAVLKLGDEVQVMVLQVDKQRNRIGLSIKQAQPSASSTASRSKEKNKATPSDQPSSMEDALSKLQSRFRK